MHASCDEPSLHNLPTRPHVIQDFLKQSRRPRDSKAWYRSPRSRPLQSQNPESLIKTFCLSSLILPSTPITHSTKPNSHHSSTSILNNRNSTTSQPYDSTTTTTTTTTIMQISNYALSLLVPAYLVVAQDLGAAITSGLGDAGGAVCSSNNSQHPSISSNISSRSHLPLVVLARPPCLPFLLSAQA